MEKRRQMTAAWRARKKQEKQQEKVVEIKKTA
jgi:hypothetical protein